MHTFLAALFTLVFSFSHSASLRRSEALDTVAAFSAHSHSAYAPSRRELAHVGLLSGSYAGTACSSCRKMNALYRMH